eukprot:COSAG02_NODE_69_length_42323_cov_23.507850_39_plen_53_part_00
MNSDLIISEIIAGSVTEFPILCSCRDCRCFRGPHTCKPAGCGATIGEFQPGV